ncbi:MAG: arginyl-tRNA synthetase [Solirubrobacterales bacterium]|jgi:arginyl-tRNA synthetase|nr:arginyl-tRNA synthetase [Solirubrobacterales bacterium]
MGATMATADPIAELRAAVEEASRALRDGEPTGPEPTLERPPKAELGDYSSNAAMLLAAPLGENPRDVAGRLADRLREQLGQGTVERIEVAGPGFVNFFLADEWYRRAMVSLAGAGGRLGSAPTEASERTLVEFVSANPTGPLHVGGGRHAAYGDALVRLLEAAGHEVQREFYVNDAGGQIERFAASIAARMRGEEPPEDGYGGDYVIEFGERIAAEGVEPDDLEAIGSRGVELILENVRATLDRFGVRFDNWFSERDLYSRGEVDAALAQLDQQGHTYRSEEALWLRTTSFGDDKDRVLIRANGEPTYLAADVAYHWDKLERGFERLIDVLGADHHGYVARLRAAIAGLGADPERFEALIMRLVHIVESGERAQMSKRSGDFVALDELLDDIGVDATRWFMLWRSHDTTVDLDLELARRQSNDNPVYYVQYAHARIASILRKAGQEPESAASGAGAATPGTPLDPTERELIKRLLEFPEEVREAAARRAPHRICTYSTAVAADFHAFYRDCQVVGAEGDGVERSRLALALLTKRTIAGALGLLGISAPERM